MPEYYHHLGKLSQPKGFSIAKDQILSVNGSEVLAVQYKDEAETHYVGIARVTRGRFKTFAGVEISDIASLNGLSRPDLEKAIREAGFEGIFVSLQPDSP